MDSFVFYESFAEAAATLGDKARLKLYDAVVKLGLSCAEDEPTLNQVCADIESSLAQSRNVFAQFLLIKPQILANFKRKMNGRKGAEFGRLGGAPKGNTNAAKNNPKTTPNVNVNVNVNNNKKENIKRKIIFSEVNDWESLFTYWEENKTGGGYKNEESRCRMLTKLKELTKNNLDFAKEAILFCLDNKYQGFTNGNELYYKGKVNKYSDDDEENAKWEQLFARVEAREKNNE